MLLSFGQKIPFFWSFFVEAYSHDKDRKHADGLAKGGSGGRGEKTIPTSANKHLHRGGVEESTINEASSLIKLEGHVPF